MGWREGGGLTVRRGREVQSAVTAGGRISLSYLELMYKMKWGSLQLKLQKSTTSEL